MSETAAPAHTEELAAAHDEYDAAAERVSAHGEAELEALADAHDRATTLFDKYEERATGTGDFEGFVEFQERFGQLVDGLDAELLEREAFETANERFDKRRLSSSDFTAARETLSSARDLAAILDERDEKRERYHEARRRVVARRDELDEEVADLERLQQRGTVDLDAPVEAIRDPIETYNESVTDAFRDFKNEANARELFAFLLKTAHYPLVPFRRPPDDLREYVENSSVGTESISSLVEYADYSTSKLDHYVENPQELKRHVAVHRSYLDRIDAEPLVVAWPPPPADELRYRLRELVSVVGRFAPESTVVRLRELRDLVRTDRYDHLQRAANAHADLTPAERTRLVEGDVADELATARDERDRLDDALAAHPGP